MPIRGTGPSFNAPTMGMPGFQQPAASHRLACFFVSGGFALKSLGPQKDSEASRHGNARCVAGAGEHSPPA